MRILLVDDDPSVVQALLPVLRNLPGHDVRTAGSGEEALEVVAALGGIDLLITDVVMEPLDGFALSEHLRSQSAALRTIFITGYDLSDYAERIGSLPLLQKPVSIDTLAAAVQLEFSEWQAQAASGPTPRAAVAKAVPTAKPQTAKPQAMPVPRAVTGPKVP